MQGPMNTILRSSPCKRRSTRAMATMGETIGASARSDRDNIARHSPRWPGRWSKYSDGHWTARSTRNISGQRDRHRRQTSVTKWKPNARSMPTTCVCEISENSAGKLGARQAAMRLRSAASYAPHRPCCAGAWHAANRCHAIAAGDATVADHPGLALGNANGLDRALPHARVAHAAAFGDRGDERGAHEATLPVNSSINGHPIIAAHRVGHNAYAADDGSFLPAACREIRHKVAAPPHYGARSGPVPARRWHTGPACAPRTASRLAPMGWPPPPMHPPGQVITSMKCRSLRPARI